MASLKKVTGAGLFIGASLFVYACAQNGEVAGRQASQTVRSAASQSVQSSVPASAEERIRADVTWLADDARLGREAGTQGYLDAANYMVETFQSLGLAPGNGASYLQDVTFRITKRDDAAAFMSITGTDGVEQPFTYKKEYIAGRSAQGTSFDVTAPLVFAGFGVSGPDYDDYENLDVDGKIVVVFGGAPRALNSETRAHFGRGSTKAQIAEARGAKGMIFLSANAQNAEAAWERAVGFPDNGSWSWVSPDGISGATVGDMAPTFSLGPEGSNAIFAGAPMSFEEVRKRANDQSPDAPMQSFELPFTATLKGSGQIQDLRSPNVVGVIEGSDPELRNEVIVLSAHLDHVGEYEPRGGGDDHIHNGAMDNAMGIATMLEVARRFKSEGAPRRTVMFLAVTAEEKGLLGSDYFANFPTVDADRIVGNVNLDMPLVLFPFTDVIAFGAQRSTLGETVKAAAAKTDVEIIPDPWPNLRLFTRSDHYSFVKQGVPSVFLFLGTGNGGEEVFNNFMSTHYHRPSDQPDLEIKWDHAARFANLNYLIAREISDADERPQWKEGDFFGEIFGR